MGRFGFARAPFFVGTTFLAIVFLWSGLLPFNEGSLGQALLACLDAHERGRVGLKDLIWAT